MNKLSEPDKPDELIGPNALKKSSELDDPNGPGRHDDPNGPGGLEALNRPYETDD